MSKNYLIQIVFWLLFLIQLGCANEAKIAELREKYGGKNKLIISLPTRPFERLEETLPHASQIDELRILYCGSKQLTAEHVKMIGNLTQLKELKLDNINLSTNDLQPISNLKNLKILKIVYAPNVDEEIFKTIAPLKQLQQLEINIPNCDGSTLHLLTDNQNLVDLKLDCEDLTDAVVPNLIKMPQLQKLTMMGSKVTEKGISQLMELVNLVEFSAPDIPMESRKAMAYKALAARRKARAAGQPAAPDLLVPYGALLPPEVLQPEIYKAKP